MNVLDLFSGIGGFSLGLERAGMHTVAFCEIDLYCQRVLIKRWPAVPVFGDIRNLTAAVLADAINLRELQSQGGEQNERRWIADGGVDVICGGFPCQDISVAGKGAGIAGERSGLWSEFARIIGEVRPRYVIVENVAALLGRGIERVLGDLAALGFSSVWHCIPASAVGAPHRRDRVWIIARNNDYARCQAIADRCCHFEAALRERQENTERNSGPAQYDLETCGGGTQGGWCEDAERPRSERPQAVASLPDIGSAEFGPSFNEGRGCPSPQFGLAGQSEREPCRCVEEDALAFSQAIGSYLSGVIHGGIGRFQLRGRISDDGSPQENGGLDVGNESIPAAAVGAPHRRDRVWIVADAVRDVRGEQETSGTGPERTGQRGKQDDVADSRSAGLEGSRDVASTQTIAQTGQSLFSREGHANANGKPTRRLTISWGECDQWLVEPDVGRVAHGIPFRVDRLRALGNGLIPQIAEIIGKAIMAAESGIVSQSQRSINLG